MDKKKKVTKKKSTKKEVVKYKSIYTGKSLTIQQFLVEILYSNRGIKDVTKYIGGNAYRRKEYIKNISVVSRLLKKTSPEELILIIIKQKVKKPEDLPWRIEKFNYIKELEELPKDYSKPKEVIFNSGIDLRNKGKKDIKKLSIFEQINDLGENDE